MCIKVRYMHVGVRARGWVGVHRGAGWVGVHRTLDGVSFVSVQARKCLAHSKPILNDV